MNFDHALPSPMEGHGPIRLASATGPKIVERVNCVTTPGGTIDVVVTKAGIAVNPRREQLSRDLTAVGMPMKLIDELRAIAFAPHKSDATHDDESRIVGAVEYRDETVIDLIRATAR